MEQKEKMTNKNLVGKIITSITLVGTLVFGGCSSKQECERYYFSGIIDGNRVEFSNKYNLGRLRLYVTKPNRAIEDYFAEEKHSGICELEVFSSRILNEEGRGKIIYRINHKSDYQDALLNEIEQSQKQSNDSLIEIAQEHFDDYLVKILEAKK